VRVGDCQRRRTSMPRPSSRPRRTSVGISRMVRVTGATISQVSAGTVSLRVTTRTGRRLSSASAHQISAWRGWLTTAPRRLTTAPRRSSASSLRPRPHHPRTEAAAGTPRRWRRPCVPGALVQQHLKAEPHGFRSGTDHAGGDELVDLLHQLVVDSRHQLRHTNSMHCKGPRYRERCPTRWAPLDVPRYTGLAAHGQGRRGLTAAQGTRPASHASSAGWAALGRGTGWRAPLIGMSEFVGDVACEGVAAHSVPCLKGRQGDGFCLTVGALAGTAALALERRVVGCWPGIVYYPSPRSSGDRASVS
jgi:hypothetical protein